MVNNQNSGPNKRPEKSNESDDFIIGPVTRVKTTKKDESRVLVLDYLPEGKGFGQTKQREPTIQGIGTTWFSLLDMVVDRKGSFPQFTELPLPKISEETPIKQIKRRITIHDLTNTGYESLEEAVLKIINKNEKRFVSFFNKAQPITNRIHSLQLVPGIGKKLMWEIIQTRKGMPFVSFDDIEERVKISDIRKMILNRIMQELEGDEKHRLFTASSDSGQRR
jgi:putative nucleotide binding protein